jgi:hypothetical protein
MKKIITTVITVIVCCCFIIISCNKSKDGSTSSLLLSKSIITDTITNLSQMTGNQAIWNDNGTFRTVTIVSDDEAEHDEETPSPNAGSTCTRNFSGVARASAKISFASATTRNYVSFSTLRNSLALDNTMRNLGITNSSPRVSQENKNVRLTNRYLYALKRESDGDLHIIMGDASSTNFLNCEASGYPSSSAASYTAIKNVRDAIFTRFGTDFCSRTSYMIFSPALPVSEIAGSMFYDIDHAPGTIGPTGYRPTTSWEIHPMSAIGF